MQSRPRAVRSTKVLRPSRSSAVRVTRSASPSRLRYRVAVACDTPDPMQTAETLTLEHLPDRKADHTPEWIQVGG